MTIIFGRHMDIDSFNKAAPNIFRSSFFKIHPPELPT